MSFLMITQSMVLMETRDTPTAPLGAVTQTRTPWIYPFTLSIVFWLEISSSHEVQLTIRVYTLTIWGGQAALN